MNYIIAPASGDIRHSAKGSEWKEHKYLKRIDGTYYYPDSYEGGRHLPNGQKKTSKSDEDKKETKQEATYYEYDPNDPDMDDKYFDKKNRIDSDAGEFYAYTKPDGTVVIIEEDMCWKVPNGDIKEISKRLKDLGKNIPQDGKHTNADYIKWATEAINGKTSKEKLSDNDIEKLAKEVIRGNFGNGEKRKELLGDDYQEIQNKVNELMKGMKTSSSSSSKNTSNSTKDEKEEVKENKNEDAKDDEKKKKTKKPTLTATTYKSKDTNTVKHGLDIPLYELRPSNRIIYW